MSMRRWSGAVHSYMGWIYIERLLHPNGTMPRSDKLPHHINSPSISPPFRINFLVHINSRKRVQKKPKIPLRLANPALAASFNRRVLQA
jgi:hypothetical protein